MSEFVELQDGWGFRRSTIIGYRVLPALITPSHRKPSVVVWVDGMPEDFQVEFDSLDEAKAAVRKIRGVVPSECTEWSDSRITCPSTTINFRTQESPILWGRWSDGGEGPFRVSRHGDGTLLFNAVSHELPKSKHPMDQLIAMPDFWRHMPVEEKIEILDRIHKAQNEGDGNE